MDDKNTIVTGADKATLEQLIEKSRELKEQAKKTSENLAELQQDAKELLKESATEESHGDSTGNN